MTYFYRGGSPLFVRLAPGHGPRTFMHPTRMHRKCAPRTPIPSPLLTASPPPLPLTHTHRYYPVGAGSGWLEAGGSFVTLTNAASSGVAGTHVTIVIEKMDPHQSQCEWEVSVLPHMSWQPLCKREMCTILLLLALCRQTKARMGVLMRTDEHTIRHGCEHKNVCFCGSHLLTDTADGVLRSRTPARNRVRRTGPRQPPRWRTLPCPRASRRCGCGGQTSRAAPTLPTCLPTFALCLWWTALCGE
jgi:hypothetical protein